MFRVTLIALSALAAVAATADIALAQAGSPVRSLRTAEAVGSTALMAPKEVRCSEKTCAGKPAKRYVGAPSLGW